MREQILDWFCHALREIPSDYFHLNTLGGPIVRERVFCYELYHRLRVSQSRNPMLMDLTLNGEIDKRGHSKFRDARKNPDFVFHFPGEMGRNTCVIEVKGKIEPAKITKDFQTLLTFVGAKLYKQGLFVLYNHTDEELQQQIETSIQTNRYFDQADKIDILTISHSHADVQRTTLDALIQEPTHD